MSDTGSRHDRSGLRASARLAAVAALSLVLASCGRQIDGDCTSPEIVEKAKANIGIADFESRPRVLASLASIGKFIKSSDSLGFAQSALIDFAAKNQASLSKIKADDPAMFATLAVDPERIERFNALATGDVKVANEILLLALGGDAEARDLFRQILADTGLCRIGSKCRPVLQDLLNGSSKDIGRLQDEIRALKPNYGIFQIEVASFDKPMQKLVCESYASAKFEGEELEEKLRIRYVVEKPSRQELRVTVSVIK